MKKIKLERRGRPRHFKAWGTLSLLMGLILVILSLSIVWGVYQYQHQPLVSPLSTGVGQNLPTDEMELVDPKAIANWESFKQQATQLAKIYDYPVNVLLAQAALESRRGQSHFAKDRFNFFGIGAYDRDPNLAFGYSSPAECIIEYMRLIKKEYPKAYALRKNPDAMIQAIKDRGFASDPNYVTKVRSMAEWRYQ